MPILNGTTLLARARRLADDQTAPYYISDTEMYIWLTEAERDLAVAGKLIRDVVTYTVDDDDYSRWIEIGTVPEILEFRDATLIDDNSNRYSLTLQGTMDSFPTVIDLNDYGLIRLYDSLSPGRPEAIFFGKKTKYFELRPISNDDYTIEASVVTYPAAPIEYAWDEPTIPERYHQYIPVGAALKAMDGSDDEQLAEKVTQLQRVWNMGLAKAADEAGRMNRDASVVRFSNDLWSMY